MALMGRGAPPEWLSTHPEGKNRIAEIEKRLPSALPLYAQAKQARLDALPPYQSNVRGIEPIR